MHELFTILTNFDTRWAICFSWLIAEPDDFWFNLGKGIKKQEM